MRNEPRAISDKFYLTGKRWGRSVAPIMYIMLHRVQVEGDLLFEGGVAGADEAAAVHEQRWGAVHIQGPAFLD